MEHADKLKTISYWGIFLSCFSDFSEKCIHAAPEHVLVYVYSGEQIIEDRNKKIKIKAGECAFIRRNHRLLMYKNSKGNDLYKGISLTFNRSVLREFYINKFASQMLLLPVSVADGVLDVDRLGRYDAELDYREALGRAVLTLGGVRLVSATCWWDPAFARPGGEGTGKAGDGSVVAAVFGGEDGRFYLHRVLYLAVDPKAAETEADQQCRQVARLIADAHLPAIHIEINGIGRFLPGLLRERLRHDRLAAAVVEQSSHTPKARRILEAFDALLADRRLLAHRLVWETPLIREMRDWRPDGRYRGPDDGLDAVAGCLGAEPHRFDRSVRLPDRRSDWRGAGMPTVAAADWEL